MPTVQVLLFSRRPPTLEPSAVFESAANAIHAQKRLAAPQTGVAQPEDDWSVGEESVVQIKPPQRLKSAPVHSALKRCILPSNGHPLALPPLPPPTTSENIITASLAIPKPDYDTLAVIRQYFLHYLRSDYKEPTILATRTVRSAKMQHSFVKTPANHLQPGRRGTWLIPLSGSFGAIPGSSAGTWTKGNPATDRDKPPSAIVWTQERIDAVWTMIKRIQASNQLGHIVAFVQIEPESLDSPPIKSTAPTPPLFPPHIRIGVDGSFALKVRLTLALTQVGKCDGKDEDKVQFLHPDLGIRLVYVDETGRSIFLA